VELAHTCVCVCVCVCVCIYRLRVGTVLHVCVRVKALGLAQRLKTVFPFWSLQHNTKPLGGSLTACPAAGEPLTETRGSGDQKLGGCVCVCVCVFACMYADKVYMCVLVF